MKAYLVRRKKIIMALAFICVAVSICLANNAFAAEAFKYSLLEQFPGFFNSGDSPSFPDMVSALYSFGIWTVGIAAFFMLIIGGFMYITSAGNTSSVGTAKKIIWDALLGLVAALVAYLILYVINPDLVNLNLNLIKVGINSQGVSYGEGAYMGPGMSDSSARSKLNAAGITINKDNCKKFGDTDCTSLDGIPENAINNLITLYNACKSFDSACTFVVTGGTEAGHKSHGPGKPMIDIRDNGVVRKFLVKARTEKKYANFGIGQICTVAPGDLKSISYNHSYDRTCQDPSSVTHFHFSING